MQILSAIKDLQEQRKSNLENSIVSTPTVSTPTLAEEHFCKQVCETLERLDLKSRAIVMFRIQKVLFEVEFPEGS